MKGKHLVMSVAVLLLLTSCYTRMPTQNKLSEAKLGPKPSREVALEASTGWLKNRCPQDGLPRVAFGRIEPGFYANGRETTAQRFAWVLGSVDAKNDYGLFEGAKPYHFYFLGSELVGCAFPRST